MAIAEPKNLLLLALMVAILFMAFQTMLGPQVAEIATGISHANLRHGAEADVARQCADGRPGHLFHNPTTNRFGVVCQLYDGWGVVITDEAGNEITAFLKKKMKRFEQVLKYMQNQGYEIVQ